MVTFRPWLVCCLVLAGVTCVGLICLCVVSLVAAGCPRGGFRRAAVAADSRLCSEVGRDMLLQGGSAVDGAIAALLCTSLVNPQSMGLGGGSIITIRNKTGAVKVYNFRETVPRSFKSNLLSDCPKKMMLSRGTQWIGVPGELRGYEAVHRQYGRLPWAKLFEPTIKLAREGITMPMFLSRLLSDPLVKNHVKNSSLCTILCNTNTSGERDLLRYPKLADTMEVIAKQGADAFYTGKIGQDLIQDIKDAGGTLEMEDLKSFKVKVENPRVVSFGNTEIYFPPPPAGGALLAFILKLMKEFPMTPNSSDVHQKIQMYHHYIEAAKFANGQKRSISDPDFNDKKSADHLIDPSFIERIRGMISPNRTYDISYYLKAKPTADNFGTTHVSVLDEDGLAVSATSTINQIFGGAIYSPRTGIILNNELSDFCQRADSVRAGEQPPSSMTPIIAVSKSGGLLVMGGSGGSMITSAVALAIMNRLWLGMDLKDAIAAPIVFVDGRNNLNFEPHFDKSVIEGLKALGHNVGNSRIFFNVVNAVEMEDGCIVAVSDTRKNGSSAGY